MAPTIRCPQCRVVLNIPAEAGHRRLKCPGCGARFHAEGPRSESPGVATAGPSSSEVAKRPSSQNIISRPPKDLRETFDLPLLEEDSPGEGVAAGLFREERPVKRPLSAAEARREARDCPSCGLLIPMGMSLCEGCGLDLDTGEYVEAAPEMEEDEDDLLPRVAPRPATPFGVFFVGSLAALVSVVLCILSLVKLGDGYGGILLALVSLFGLYGAVQFLLGHTVKPLLVALAIAGGVDIVGLIVLPVFHANEHVSAPLPDDPAFDEETVAIPRFIDRLDVPKIQWGIALLIVDAAAMIYLSTGGVRRHFARVSPVDEGPIAL